MNIEHLKNWNPWWSSGEIPKILTGVKRDVNPLIFKSIKEREIIILTGIRRCGKTTIMYQMAKSLLDNCEASQILYLNLDDELLKKENLEDIYNIYREYKNPDKKAYIFLDEIQNVKNWEGFLKKHYDLRDNVKFIVSGSCANLLKKEYSTLLTGRNLTFKISPLSFKEYLNFSKIDYNFINTQTKNKILYALNKFLENGGFPEAYFKEKEIKHLLLKEYFDDIIYKDIVSRHNINAKKITNLAVYFITNISNLFTIRKIRNSTGLSIDSIKDYLSYLEDSFLISVLDFFSYSAKENNQMPRKSYCIDTGLRNAVSFKFSKDFGRLVENLTFTELKKRYNEIYYWKNAKHQEVDFIIKNKDRSLTAMNVSYTNEINEREIKGLLEFKKEFKKTKKLILLTKDLEKKEKIENKTIWFIPLWKWLLE